MRVELAGFAPDVDPTTPGILTDCDNVVPSTQGLCAGNSRVSAGYSALSGACTGAYVAKLLGGTKRLFAGTSAALYEGSGGSWTDQSAGGGYTGTNRWRFCQFGDYTLATNKSQAIQVSPGSGAFAAIATAPKALSIFTVAGFVMALNYDNGSDVPDGWYCSGLMDHTIWTPAVATQCANGRLVETPGAIVGGAALGSQAVAYKATSMFLGTYQGGGAIWTWQRVPGDIGCASQEAIVSVQTLHFFIGPSDFYSFDGTVPRSIGAPVREWFFADLNRTYQDKIIGVADPARDLVYWYYPSTASASGACDSVLIYNYRKDQWGRADASIEAAVEYSYGQTTYDGLGGSYSTYEDLPDISYDSPFWLADSTVPAIFDTAHTLQSLTGDPGASYWVTGAIGDQTEYTFVSRVSPRWRYTPTAGSMLNYYRDSLSDTPTGDAVALMSRNRFDCLRDARYHSFRFEFTSRVAMDGLDIAAEQSSRE